MHARGLHHITAITNDANRTIDFYTRVLGLRFVKQTVNFDDPTSYHLYFGDTTGSPGTALTFFVWNVPVGAPGPGSISGIYFLAPRGSLDAWGAHLAAAGIEHERGEDEHGDDCITFADPDGLQLILIEGDRPESTDAWESAAVPPAQALYGFAGIELWAAEAGAMHEFLTNVFGYTHESDMHTRARYIAEHASIGRRIYLRAEPAAAARAGAGSIHHAAFRAPDDDGQAQWRDRLSAAGLDVTPVINRFYFRSIYFRIPDDILFEIATDEPGFTADEDAAHLGERLQLPPWYEAHRDEIEAALPPITFRT